MQMEPKARHKSFRLGLYNHKGGVGKTVLTTNIAAALSLHNKRVLLVDSDPQSNLTSYLFEDSVVDDLLDKSDSDKGRTLWSALKQIVEAEGDFRYVEPYETHIANVFLVPGDIKLAEFEESLNEFWNLCYKRKPRGFRGANSLSAFVNECSIKHKIDYVFYDTGPNIGPLNRSILLDCEFFVVPAACDLFSTRALKTLGRKIGDWVQEWDTIQTLAPNNVYMMPGKPKCLGYIPQRFKVYGGTISQTASREVSQIEKALNSDVITVMRKINPDLVSKSGKGLKLGEIKDFSSLVPLAQKQGVPIWNVNGGAQYLKDEAKNAFDKIAQNIIKNSAGD
jgi:cellulose biosynthesis protein BcsQ